MGSDDFMLIFERGEEVFNRKRAQAIQRIKRMHSTERRFGLSREFLEQRNRCAILAFIKQARRGVTMPAVGIRERADQFGGGGFTELREFGLFEIIGDDSINATAVISAVEVE